MSKDLVFIHGWGMNQSVWQLCVDDITPWYTSEIKCLNIPGFGGAPLPKGEYSFTSAAELLAEQLSSNSTIVAWSLGGLFALYLAKNYSEKVNKVILVASSPCFVEREGWFGLNEQVLSNFEQQLLHNSDKTIERFLAIQAMGSEHAKDDIKALRMLLSQSPKADEKALKAGLKILKQQDLRADFSQLETPIYGCFGRLDSLVPKRTCQTMAELNPHFQYEILPKASHAPFISHRAEFISYLKSVL